MGEECLPYSLASGSRAPRRPLRPIAAVIGPGGTQGATDADGDGAPGPETLVLMG